MTQGWRWGTGRVGDLRTDPAGGPGAPVGDTGPEDGMESQPKRRAGGNPRDVLRGRQRGGRRGVGSGISRFPRHRWAEARIEGAGAGARRGGAGGPRALGQGRAVSAGAWAAASPSVPPAGARPSASVLTGWGVGVAERDTDKYSRGSSVPRPILGEPRPTPPSRLSTHPGPGPRSLPQPERLIQLTNSRHDRRAVPQRLRVGGGGAPAAGAGR